MAKTWTHPDRRVRILGPLNFGWFLMTKRIKHWPGPNGYLIHTCPFGCISIYPHEILLEPPVLLAASSLAFFLFSLVFWMIHFAVTNCISINVPWWNLKILSVFWMANSAFFRLRLPCWAPKISSRPERWNASAKLWTEVPRRSRCDFRSEMEISWGVDQWLVMTSDY